jgi:uncharacterized protein (TIGR03067 family)
MLISAVTGVKPARDDKSELELLQGTWRVVVASSGNANKDTRLSMFSLEIKEEKYRMHIRNIPESTGTFKLSTNPKPKHIDFFSDQSATPKEPKMGIYKIEKDRLTMCWDTSSFVPERPTDFVIEKPNRRILLILERVKK